MLTSPGARQRLTVAFFALATLAATRASQEFTATAVMPVTIEIAGSCTVSAADLDFGTYATTSPMPARGQSVVQLQCTNGLTVDVGLDAGTAPGATTSNRRLVSGNDLLTYGLYQDAARTINWGDTTGADTLELQATGLLQSVPVYGEIPAGQRVPAGTYGDVITVRLQF